MTIRLATLLALAVPSLLTAQVRASELGTVSQIIDGTKISIVYSRPRARGRDTLFGTKAVKWGETWTPGANWATTLEVSRTVKINGLPVPTGKYSVWMVVRQDGNWTTVLEPDSHRYHMDPPDSSSTQIRIPVHVETVPFTDVLTWSMPELRMNGGTLAMQWERARVSMNVEVEPSLVMTIPAADARLYVGRYRMAEKDSAKKDSTISELSITHEAGVLRGRFTPEDNYLKKFALVRVAPDWFAIGVYDKGEIYEILKPDMVLEFSRTKGAITGFVIRDPDDDVVWGVATRLRSPD